GREEQEGAGPAEPQLGRQPREEPIRVEEGYPPVEDALARPRGPSDTRSRCDAAYPLESRRAPHQSQRRCAVVSRFFLGRLEEPLGPGPLPKLVQLLLG